MIEFLRRLSRASLLLLLLCGLLLGIIYVELAPPLSEARAKLPLPRPRGADPAPSPRPGFSMPPLDSFAEVVTRPMFSETRRPPLPSGESGDARSSAFTLVGIIVSAGESRALIAHGQPPRLERVTEGQEIDGWTVEKVLPDRVILERADARIEVKPRDAPPSPAPPRRPGVPGGGGSATDRSGGLQQGIAPGGDPAR